MDSFSLPPLRFDLPRRDDHRSTVSAQRVTRSTQSSRHPSVSSNNSNKGAKKRRGGPPPPPPGWLKQSSRQSSLLRSEEAMNRTASVGGTTTIRRDEHQDTFPSSSATIQPTTTTTTTRSVSLGFGQQSVPSHTAATTTSNSSSNNNSSHWQNRNDTHRLCELEHELVSLEQRERELIGQLNDIVTKRQDGDMFWHHLEQGWEELYKANAELLSEPPLDLRGEEEEALRKLRTAEHALAEAEDGWGQVHAHGEWVETAEAKHAEHSRRIQELMRLAEQIEVERNEVLKMGANALQVEREREQMALEMARLSEAVIAKEFGSGLERNVQKTPQDDASAIFELPKQIS